MEPGSHSVTWNGLDENDPAQIDKGGTEMLKITVLLLTIAAISLFAACNLTDTRTEKTSLEIEQGALFSKGAGPENPGKGAFYPLTIGNTWTYTGEFSMRIGSGSAYSASRDETRTIIGTEELFGREYMLEEQVLFAGSLYGGVDTFTYWVRHRQDRAGLYEADVAMSDPPGEEGDMGLAGWDALWKRAVDELGPIDAKAAEKARAAHFRKIDAVNELIGRKAGSPFLTGPPGGILPDEIQRLKYPLHPGQEWIIRDSPLFYTVVEGLEVLDLPAGRMNGWRTFIYNEFLDENDIVHFWFGRQGFLCMKVHLETEDDMFGLLITDESLYLVDYDLEGKGNKEDDCEDREKADSKGSLLSDL